VADVAGVVSSSCPKMRVLATSREPLDLDGERVRRVRSLSVDRDGTAADLFRLRAEEAGASLDPERDADAVVQICARLDGIPLAIELAAARTRSLRPAEIAVRLEYMFRLLTGGKRASTERHRTLRATLEWSHDMLSAAEQAVLARLSVFAGSFVLDAAEAVAGDGEVIDVLDRLVARSLVVPVDTADETRLRLLEPVRQLAAEKLAARGEADRTRAQHTDWYLALMKRLGSLWRTGHDQEAWPVAARELPNLRAAFDHLIETVRVDDAEGFVVGSYGPIACQFDVTPMYEWAPKVLGLAPNHVGPDTASVCAIAAWGAIPRGDFDAATMYLRRGVDAITAGSRDDGLVSAAAIHSVLSGGDLAVSDEFLEASVTSALESDDLHRQVWVLTYAGRAKEAAERAEKLGNRMLLAMARESHSYLMRNGADLELGKKQLRVGAPLDALLLLRSPLRDWLLRGDARVWVVLHAIARALVALGEGESAARFAGAIGDRPLPFMSPRARAALASLLDGCLESEVRARHEAAGRGLDAGTAAMEALNRIEALANAASLQAGATSVDAADLTPRQHDVAALVARGLPNKQIAQRLGISRYTAETHVRNILERLGAASRSEIATWYARQQATGSGMPVHT
jgi:DNA-binding CsgD family transcriptional regulator